MPDSPTVVFSEIALRAAQADDLPFLTDMLVAAVNWPSDRRIPRERILADQSLAHYVTGWPRTGDHGIVAWAGQRRLGAVWLRVFPCEDPGYGFVSADVPELSIGVVAGHRGQGLGRALLRAMIGAAASPRISLSVERANPARGLYLSEGFRVVSSGGDSDTMVLD